MILVFFFKQKTADEMRINDLSSDVCSSDLFGGIKGDCAYNAARGISTHAYVDGTPVNCKTKDVWNLDLTVSQKVADKFTIYANVLNLLDTKPPFDPDAAYGLFGFNPAWAGPNVMGRYFRVGAKVEDRNGVVWGKRV